MHGVPEQLPIETLHYGMSHARQNHELTIAIGELLEEILQIVNRRDAVVLAADQQYRGRDLLRIDQGSFDVMSR